MQCAVDAVALFTEEIAMDGIVAALAGALYLGERLSRDPADGRGGYIICILAVQLAPMFTRKTVEAV